jgi:hypothetical protein
MALTVGVALLVIIVVTAALAARLLRRPARVAVAVEPVEVSPPLESPIPDLVEAELPEPALLEPALPEPEPEPEPVITWTLALSATTLDEAARLRLIDDLTLLAAPWTIALLRRAYQEESSPELRVRIEAALASSGEPVATTS